MHTRQDAQLALPGFCLPHRITDSMGEAQEGMDRPSSGLAQALDAKGAKGTGRSLPDSHFVWGLGEGHQRVDDTRLAQAGGAPEPGSRRAEGINNPVATGSPAGMFPGKGQVWLGTSPGLLRDSLSWRGPSSQELSSPRASQPALEEGEDGQGGLAYMSTSSSHLSQASLTE